MPQTITTPMRDRRLERGLTLRDVADECADRGVPVDNSQLSKIERRLATPRPKLRAVLAEFFELDIDQLEAHPEAKTA
jgi:transcriptional regulator with XRE-family HTH domain